MKLAGVSFLLLPSRLPGHIKVLAVAKLLHPDCRLKLQGISDLRLFQLRMMKRWSCSCSHSRAATNLSSQSTRFRPWRRMQRVAFWVLIQHHHSLAPGVVKPPRTISLLRGALLFVVLHLHTFPIPWDLLASRSSFLSCRIMGARTSIIPLDLVGLTCLIGFRRFLWMILVCCLGRFWIGRMKFGRVRM